MSYKDFLKTYIRKILNFVIFKTTRFGDLGYPLTKACYQFRYSANSTLVSTRGRCHPKHLRRDFQKREPLFPSLVHKNNTSHLLNVTCNSTYHLCYHYFLPEIRLLFFLLPPLPHAHLPGHFPTHHSPF